MVKKNNQRAFAVIALLLLATIANAQQVATGVDAAATEVKGIFSNVSNLVLMLGGITGLVGGIRVFLKWQSGEEHIQKHIVGWMGACVFLLLTSTILKTMFGM